VLESIFIAGDSAVNKIEKAPPYPQRNKGLEKSCFVPVKIAAYLTVDIIKTLVCTYNNSHWHFAVVSLKV
jgi:hypothetical protein